MGAAPRGASSARGRRAHVQVPRCAGYVNEVEGEVPRRFPSSHRASRSCQVRRGSWEDLITDLINRLRTKTPPEARAIERLLQEIAKLNRDQDMKSNDHVGRVQCVLDSFAVRLRDDAEFATKVQDARHDQTRSHTTTITESLGSKLRDEIKTTSSS